MQGMIDMLFRMDIYIIWIDFSSWDIMIISIWIMYINWVLFNIIVWHFYSVIFIISIVFLVDVVIFVIDDMFSMIYGVFDWTIMYYCWWVIIFIWWVCRYSFIWWVFVNRCFRFVVIDFNFEWELFNVFQCVIDIIDRCFSIVFRWVDISIIFWQFIIIIFIFILLINWF
jgi:hypothetical protein